MFTWYVLFEMLLLIVPICRTDFALRQCEPIRIEMCRNIGYNETSMPNLVGNELQSEVEYTLQTFSPLIEYVCSSQLKLFLCATYVPMCTPKVTEAIGPCRSLCESVRARCYPVLQGFGFPWPPALDCSLFPKENNQETMCMEGPGEILDEPASLDLYPGLTNAKQPTEAPSLECPGLSKLYVKLHRSGRCAPLCEADILFNQNEKHIAEVWTHTWTYAALGIAIPAILCVIIGSDSKSKPEMNKDTKVLSPVMWCHTMVAIGWTVRFVAGRTATSCGFDPQLPNVSLLLIDGLSNVICATTFILRYYFGMAACAWWAILCMGWHRDVRRQSPDSQGHITLGSIYSAKSATKSGRACTNSKLESNITGSTLARFLAWGLPAFQTAAVIVARMVDADELLGACFVGNQSDKGLQILVATPLFCYWIFGSMNLSSGFLVHRRNKDVLQNVNCPSYQTVLQKKARIPGVFLFIYCIPYALLLLAVIYEFANTDVWLNLSPYVTSSSSTKLISMQTGTPIWPFLMKTFMELMLGITCSAWILGPKISILYKRQMNFPPIKQQNNNPVSMLHLMMNTSNHNSRAANKACSNASYQSVRQMRPHSSSPIKQQHSTGAIFMNHMTNYSLSRTMVQTTGTRFTLPNKCRTNNQSSQRYGDETIL
ncbi:frizzled 4 isoform 1-T11 [Glossina fuscipes fuscipes]